MPSTEWVDEYIASVEDYVVSSFAFVSDIGAINDSVNRLWMQVSRFGPPEMPNLGLRGLGRFEVPPPPPPPPLPPAPPRWYEEVGNWASKNKALVGAVCVSAVGAGLLAGYSASAYAKERAHTRHAQKTIGLSLSNRRRLLVVVLGGDSPLAGPLISGLVKEGYIVITSVSDPDVVAEIEAKGNGYVRALVFDPNEPSTLDAFLRSFKATLSLRFPLNAAGDPYQHSAANFLILFSVVSLLTLPSPSNNLAPIPFESLELTSTYGTYLTRTHIMPLQAIRALLPLFRSDSIRSKGAAYYFGGQKSIIVCVPAADALVGIPYASAQAMSAAATVRGAEVLRRELKQVSDPHMRDIHVVVADVGAVGNGDVFPAAADEQAMARSIHSWTPAERVVYESSYIAFLSATIRKRRASSGVDVFVTSIVSAVGRNTLKGERMSAFVTGLNLWAFKFARQIRGPRFSVGAGAITYSLASYLPTPILDSLLNISAAFRGVQRNIKLLTPESDRESQSQADEEKPVQEPEQDIGDMVATAIPETKQETSDESSASVAEAGDLLHPEASGISGIENSWISVQD